MFVTSPPREIDFEYDHNGLRTQKKVVENGITTIYDYTLHGKLITHLTKSVVDLDGVETSEELHFFYDAQSRPAFVEYNGVKFRYIHNLQGDIVAIVDSAGNTVVEYKYDAWGKPTWTNSNENSIISDINPFRYRGYVFDEETKLCYLRSRYGVLHWGRFLNKDCVLPNVFGLFALNAYVYCNNNPVVNADPNGQQTISALYSRVKQFVNDLVSALKKSSYVKNNSKRNAAKKIAVAAAERVTSAKGWSVTQMLFSKFMLGNGKKLLFDNNSMVAKAIVKEGSLKEHILGQNPRMGDSVKGTLEFQQGDLLYSIQHCSYCGIITENNGRLIADVIIDDHYDFTEIRSGRDNGVVSFATIINDAGFVAQASGLGTPYEFEVHFTIELD